MARSEASEEKRKYRLEIISKNLRFLRDHYFPGRGGSKKCSDALKMKQQQWSPWEKGLRIPTDESLKKIGQLFGVTVEQLTKKHEDLQKGLVDERTTAPCVPLNGASETMNDDTTFSNVLNLDTPVLVRGLAEDIRKQLITRLNNIKATFKFELSIVDVDVQL